MSDTKNLTIIFFSCNRLDYLRPTLASFHQKLDLTGLKVHKILIDDYPKGRDPVVFEQLCEQYQINHLVLNEENLGLSKSWAKAWSLVPIDADYIWHQEDDFLFNNRQPIQIIRLIEIFESCPVTLTQLVLKRQQWYSDGNDFTYKVTNGQVGKEIEFQTPDGQQQCVIVHQYYFNANPCIYPRWVIEEKYPHYPQESVIVCHLSKKYPNTYSGILGHAKDLPLVNHIGEYNQGKKVLEGEPGWSWLKNYDPEKKYYSRYYLKEFEGSEAT